MVDDEYIYTLQAEVWALRRLLVTFARNFPEQAVAAEQEIRELGENSHAEPRFQNPGAQRSIAALVRVATEMSEAIGLQASIEQFANRPPEGRS